MKSRVLPGRALDEPSQTLLTSRLERSPCEWPYTGWTRLAERDTTSFKMFNASFQCTVCGISKDHIRMCCRSHRRQSRCHLTAYLDKFLDGLCNVGVELFDLYGSQVHVAQKAVDDLEKRLLHAGKAFIQQLQDR